MNIIPLKADNPDGLHLKYFISKVNGKPVDEEAEYFVLRLDPPKITDSEETKAHRAACKSAVIKFAQEILKTNSKLCIDLLNRYSK